MTSSPLRPGASVNEELEYYKKQYEQLETDLADFQASSKDLEEQLERDIETAEKNERKLKEQVEKLKFESEEWKTKHNTSKKEANTAHNALQKEITSLREGKRGLEMKLRDVEVVNDDYERQARNTESSLEDVESKYNVAIERGVLLEEEVKNGEQEREALRIENQRLRDELGDLKVESEVTLEKLRLAGQDIERLRSRKPSPLAVSSLRARSPASEASGITPESPTMSTPPPKSDSASEIATPPSPPLSDAPAVTNGKAEPKTPMPKRRSLLPANGATPRQAAMRTLPRHSRGPSLASTASAATSDANKVMRPPTSTQRPRLTSRTSLAQSEGIPRSESLYQMKNLRSRMQKIEERVHSARSKLPAPRNSLTPKNSPRNASAASGATGDDLTVPSSITMRRSIRRGNSYLGSSVSQADAPPSDGNASDSPSKAANTGTVRRRESGLKRLSYGIPRPASSASNQERPGPALDRPPSAASRPASRTSQLFERPGSAAGRPPSRTSQIFERPPSAAGRPASRTSQLFERPGSRASARTPMSIHSASASVSGLPPRSSSSMGGNYATVHGTRRTHHTSASISELRRTATEVEDDGPSALSTPGRRTAASLFSGGGTLKRMSAGLPQSTQPNRRTSTGFGKREEEDKAKMPPPSVMARRGGRKMSDVGETY